MASRYTHSKVLRTIGQELEKRGIDLFELSCRRAHYTIEYSDPKPPHTQLLDISLSAEEIRSLDLDAARQRSGSFKLVNFERLPEMLRALGRYVESKNGEILKISTSASAPARDAMRLEYEERDGRIQAEELTTAAITDIAMRMYRIRLNSQTQRD